VDKESITRPGVVEYNMTKYNHTILSALQNHLVEIISIALPNILCRFEKSQQQNECDDGGWMEIDKAACRVVKFKCYEV
jgi:hypothetical protein